MADPLEDPTVKHALHLIADRDQARPGPTCPRCGRRAVNRNSTRGWCYRCEQEYDDTLREGKRRWARRARADVDRSGTVDDVDDLDKVETVDDADTRGAPIDALVSLGQVATRLGVSRQTVGRLLDDGELRGLRVRGQRRVVSGSVDDFLDRQLADGSDT